MNDFLKDKNLDLPLPATAAVIAVKSTVESPIKIIEKNNNSLINVEQEESAPEEVDHQRESDNDTPFAARETEP